MFFYLFFFYFWLFFFRFYFFSNALTQFQHTSALHQDSSLGLNPGESRMYPSLSELTGVTWKELQEFDRPGLVSALSSLMGLQLLGGPGTVYHQV